ncbi:MAG: hypothetical protein ABSG54_19860 [Terriglobia bacterium]|jgi:hypothetical protein
MSALLLGKTLVGMRAEDISRGVDLLAARPEVDAEKIIGFGVDAAAIPLLHEAVLDQRLKKVALEGVLVSYESAVRHRIQRDIFQSVIPGVLKAYDLEDLMAALAPRPTWIVNARDPMGFPVGVRKAREQYARSVEAFKSLNAADAIRLEVTEPGEGALAVYRGLK